ncbi:hypothetical protein H8D04_00645 [bacterium]|nr:hypothetical protein [bacterium]
MKHILIVLSLIFVIGCSDNSLLNPTVEHDVISLVLDSRLSVDDNGYSHLELDMSSWQTLHRISGHAYINDEPMEVLKVYWESSHYWYIGDTLGYIVKRGLTDDLEYVSYDTSYVTWFNGYEVPVVNSASYSNADGEVNTMFAPVQTMLGDTITVWSYYWNNEYEIVMDSLKIVLD